MRSPRTATWWHISRPPARPTPRSIATAEYGERVQGKPGSNTWSCRCPLKHGRPPARATRAAGPSWPCSWSACSSSYSTTPSSISPSRPFKRTSRQRPPSSSGRSTATSWSLPRCSSPGACSAIATAASASSSSASSSSRSALPPRPSPRPRGCSSGSAPSWASVVRPSCRRRWPSSRWCSRPMRGARPSGHGPARSALPWRWVPCSAACCWSIPSGSAGSPAMTGARSSSSTCPS